MQLHIITVLLLTLTGFALRLYYLSSTHPFFDEYTTVLAARQILHEGWPVLPSTLFYEHGLLATYLIAPFTALFIDMPIAQWQPAHWGLMLSRWPSVLISTLTIPLIFTLGRNINFHLSQNVALLAAGLFALSPEGIVWGGRARMYALVTLLVLLTVYWAYRGAVYPAPAKYRWLGLIALLLALLSQFGMILLIPPLIIGMLLIGWLSSRPVYPTLRITHYVSRVWFLRKAVFLEALALALIIALAIWVKRLGRPIGLADLNEVTDQNYLTELFKTISYQTAFYFSWDETIKFLARQFGIPHHLWLTLLTLVGLAIGLIFSIYKNKAEKEPPSPPDSTRSLPISYSQLFLCTVFGLVILEMVTLLQPFRRNPRYIIMVLPLFYLIAAQAIFNFRLIFPFITSENRPPKDTFTLPGTGIVGSMPYLLRITNYALRFILHPLFLLLLLTCLGFNDLRVALMTPEPAYEEAFAYIQAHWQPGDTLLTMNTPAAGLYLDRVDGFTVQNEADQFLLNAQTAPIDRWLGKPWIGTMAEFNQALNSSRRTWFVSDTIRQPVYFRGDWQAVVNSQMDLVWSKDNALIYLTRPNRLPLPSQPQQWVHANLEDVIELAGYTLERQEQKVSMEAKPSETQIVLTLFWRPLGPISIDYTTFLHLRNREGLIVAQQDRQPLEGSYPTSHWQADEMIIDPIAFPLPADLPKGRYILFTGLYRLDTLARLAVVDDQSGENAIRLGEVSLP